MKLASAAAMKELDRQAIEEQGIPSTLLMERAAAHVARAAIACAPQGSSAAIFAGSGNNGGDGFAAAVYLRKRGWDARVLLVGDRQRMTPDCREMARRFAACGGQTVDFSPDCIPFCEKADVLIDAMFGTGLHRPLGGLSLQAARLMNRLPAPTVAADISSGVAADSGEILGEAVRADRTVTFSFAKPGQFSAPGVLYSGVVEVQDIGIPQPLLDTFSGDTFAVTSRDMQGVLPRRRRDAHKGDFGKLLILAGCRGYTGAPELAAKAALRAGAGLVSLGVPQSIYEIQAVKQREAMPFPLPDDEQGRLSLAALPEIQAHMQGSSLCLLGPGLGRAPELCKLIETLIRTAEIPLVIDADGINAIAGNIDILRSAKSRIVLTPHAGEFARISAGIKETSRLAAARTFAQTYGVTLVLKGLSTVTALPDGRAYLNTTGGPALAKGGTGDVLAGMLAALLAQGIEPEKAVYLHGRAADMYAARKDEYSMLASDLIELLPDVISETFQN